MSESVRIMISIHSMGEFLNTNIFIFWHIFVCSVLFLLVYMMGWGHMASMYDSIYNTCVSYHGNFDGCSSCFWLYYFNPIKSGNASVHTQHCGYWCLGVISKHQAICIHSADKMYWTSSITKDYIDSEQHKNMKLHVEKNDTVQG